MGSWSGPAVLLGSIAVEGIRIEEDFVFSCMSARFLFSVLNVADTESYG